MYSLPKNVYRERIDFSKINTTVAIPNLIEIQKKSYERFLQMNRLPAERDGATARADALLLHPVAGLAILLAILFVMFQAVFAWARPLMEAISTGFTWLGAMVGELPLPDLVRSFLKDGVIAGVGSVVVFLPQILLLFLFIGILEDSGYLARAALIADRTMARIGLQGKSFIPLLSAYACAVPAIMATRTIENKRDRNPPRKHGNIPL